MSGIIYSGKLFITRNGGCWAILAIYDKKGEASLYITSK